MTRLLAEIQRINQTVSIADSEGMEYEDAYSTARSMSEGVLWMCVCQSVTLCMCWTGEGIEENQVNGTSEGAVRGDSIGEEEEEEDELIRTTPSAKVFKEGFLEKKGHSTAFFMWPR